MIARRCAAAPGSSRESIALGSSDTCLSATATGVVAGERQRAGEHLVQHDADRVQVAALVDVVALRLFGRDVRDAAHHHAGLRHAPACAPHTARAMPKSQSLTTSSLVTRTLAGLTSRCEQAVSVRVREAPGDLDRRSRPRPARGSTRSSRR